MSGYCYFTRFARHMPLRGMLSATTYFCDACAIWRKGGVENADGRIRHWLPRKCLAYRSPVEAFLSELGRDMEIRSFLKRCASCWNPPTGTAVG